MNQRTPSYTLETYDRYGRLQKTELLRTLTFEEFQFELERSQLPLAEVTREVFPAPHWYTVRRERYHG